MINKIISFGFLLGFLIACDQRNPIKTETEEPILVIRCDSMVTYSDGMSPVVVRGVLLHRDRSTIDSGTLHFSTQLGGIKGSANVTAGICSTFYNPIGSPSVYFDTIFADYAYNNNEDSVRAKCVIKVLPSVSPPAAAVANISLTTSASELAVAGTGGVSTATISAQVTDANGSNVKDGLPVLFRILSSPGGYLNSVGRTEDIAYTQNGRAQVTFNSSTTPGPVELFAQCSTITTQATLLSIQAGPTVHLTITSKGDSVTRDASGSWRMFVNATCTDAYYNPVKDGISVFFEFDTGYQWLKDSSSHQVNGSFDSTYKIYNEGMKIISGATTGKDYSGQFKSDWKGTAATYLTYPISVIFDSIKVKAWTVVNNQRVEGSGKLLLDLPVATYLQISATPPASQLIITSSRPSDTAYIVALLTGSGVPIAGATLLLTTDKGDILDMNGTVGGRGRTNSNGEVIFAIKFTMSQKPPTPAVDFTNNFKIVLVGRNVSQTGSFIVSYP